MMSAKLSNAKRREVYKRDGYRCALCDRSGHLQIHHLVKRSLGGSDDVMNLITLCPDCHALAHGIYLSDVSITQEDVEQACLEYLADFYAPDFNPWEVWPLKREALLEAWQDDLRIEIETIGIEKG